MFQLILIVYHVSMFQLPWLQKWMFTTLYTTLPGIMIGSTDSHISANSTGSLETEKKKMPVFKISYSKLVD